MPELKAKFTADDSQFSSKLDGLKSKVGGLRSMFGGLASGLSLAAAGAFIKSSVEMASELQDASDAIGVSTDALQAFRQEASRAGASAEKMEMALNKIAQARNEAISDPTGPAAKTFGKLFGMDASAAALKVEGFGDLETTVVAVGKALSAAGNDAEKLAAAFDLVGGRSKRMLEAIKAIGKSGVQGGFEQLDSPISADTIASLDRFMDNLKEIGVAWKGFIATRAQERLQQFGMAPQTFEEQGKLAEQASARFKKLRAENEAFTRKLTTGEDTPKPKSMVEKKLAEANAEAARKSMDKTTADLNRANDPFAAIGRAAGKDFSVDPNTGLLQKIEANTRKIEEKTPAPATGKTAGGEFARQATGSGKMSGVSGTWEYDAGKAPEAKSKPDDKGKAPEVKSKPADKTPFSPGTRAMLASFGIKVPGPEDDTPRKPMAPPADSKDNAPFSPGVRSMLASFGIKVPEPEPKQEATRKAPDVESGISEPTRPSSTGELRQRLEDFIQNKTAFPEIKKSASSFIQNKTALPEINDYLGMQFGRFANMVSPRQASEDQPDRMGWTNRPDAIRDMLPGVRESFGDVQTRDIDAFANQSQTAGRGMVASDATTSILLKIEQNTRAPKGPITIPLK